MAKLTKAQEKALQYIIDVNSRERYNTKFYEECLERYTKTGNQPMIDWALQGIEMKKNGWVLVRSYNCKTLKVLERLGYIEYKDLSTNPNVAIDWVKLL